MIKAVPVRLKGRPYSIHIGPGALSSLGSLLAKSKLKGTAFVVSQEPVWKAHGSALKSALGAAGIPHELFLAPARLESEKLKSLPHFLKILDAVIRADRKAGGVFLIALGGGVVGDVTGFVASVYKRGIPFVQIPTTVTAQVDSAIGGKTAIDLPQGKNLLGAFHQPAFVLSDTRLLSSLPDDLFRDGLAEVVKYGMIRDAKFLAWLEKNAASVLNRDEAAVEKIVSVSAKIKAQVVAGDELDTRGVRIILNFGHTVGHALEAAAGYTALSHGRAVSIGMCAAIDLSSRMGVLKDPALPGRLRKILTTFGLPVAIPAKLDPKKILEALHYDKKRLAGRNRFVLIGAAGKTVVHPDVPTDTVGQILRSIAEKPGKPEKAKRPAAAGPGLLGGWFKSSGKKPQPRGTVTNYLDRIGVAIIRWEKGNLKKGETIRIEGPQAVLEVAVGSLQINRVEVASVKRGDEFGMKVPAAVRAGDKVY